MLRHFALVTVLAAGAATLAAGDTAEASCLGPEPYSIPLAGRTDVAPSCTIELLTAQDSYVEFDVELLTVRRTDGDQPVALDHALESHLSDATIFTPVYTCDLDTCEEVETDGYQFSFDRHQLVIDGGLPPSASIEVVTDQGVVLAAFTTAADDASATGTCPSADPYDLAPPDCVEYCDVEPGCDGTDPDGPPEDGGCHIGSASSSAPAVLLLLLATLFVRRRLR